MVRIGYNSITLDEDTMNKLKEAQNRGNFKTIPETIRSLLSSSQPELLHKFHLLMSCVDSEKDPFSYLMLEIDATEKQVLAVFDLMDYTEKKIRAGKKIGHHTFETKIYKIFPKHHGDYHLAESIVGILGEQGRWVEVYKYMKKDGMNLR